MKNKPYLLLACILIGIVSCKKDAVQTTTPDQSISIPKGTQNLAYLPSGPPIFNLTFPGNTSVGMSQYSNGGYVVAGDTDPGNPASPPGHGFADIQLIKIDAAGNKIWLKTIGGSGGARPSAIIATADNGYFLAGTTGSRDGDFSSFASIPYSLGTFFMKLDSQGNVVWVKTFPDVATKTYIYNVIETRDHHFVAVGLGDAIELDNNGNELWHTVVNSGGPANIKRLQSVVQNENGDFIASGTSLGQAWLVKLSEKGCLLWQKLYGGCRGGDANGVIEDEDKNYVIAGVTRDAKRPGLGNTNGWVLKVDADGNIIWAKEYGGTSADTLNGIIALDDGSYLMAGYTDSIDGDFTSLGLTRPQPSEGWILKINKNGNSKQVKVFNAGKTSYSEFTWLVKGINHTYIAGGDAAVPPGLFSNLWVVGASVQ